MGRLTAALLATAALVDAVFPITVAVLDAEQSALFTLNRTVSLHALRPGFPWLGVAFAIHGVALLLLAAALRRLPPRPHATPTALALAGIASLGLAFYPADAPGTESLPGHIHEALAFVAFFGNNLAVLFHVAATRRSHAWQTLRTWPNAAGLAMLASSALLGLLILGAQLYGPARSYYGAMERVAIACIGFWMVATAAQGARLAFRLRAAALQEAAATPDPTPVPDPQRP